MLVFLDHYLDEPWPMKDIIAHAMFLLMGSSATAPRTECVHTEPRVSNTPPPTVVKKEYYTAGSSYVPAPQSMYTPPQQSYVPPLQPLPNQQCQYVPTQPPYVPPSQLYAPQNSYTHHQYGAPMDPNT
ncbi:hypothetical protein ID866_10693 [Astraeus odoratus]|nr:hypothetical protein ID866_10693 [Astraeus odoratus]